MLYSGPNQHSCWLALYSRSLHRWHSHFQIDSTNFNLAQCAVYWMQVALYAEYEPEKLMPLLMTSQSYGLEAAHELCKDKGLIREQVFILGRMGSVKEALHLIIQDLADIPQVICVSASNCPALPIIFFCTYHYLICAIVPYHSIHRAREHLCSGGCDSMTCCLISSSTDIAELLILHNLCSTSISKNRNYITLTVALWS